MVTRTHESANTKLKLYLTVLAIMAVIMGAFTTPYMAFASYSYWLLCVGLWFRKTPQFHATLMSFGILIDIALVLVLQIKRSAIQEAMSFSLMPIQQAHIVFSTLALILYFPTLYLGFKLMKLRKTEQTGPEYLKTRKVHRVLGLFAFGLRTVGFFLMFSMLSHVKQA